MQLKFMINLKFSQKQKKIEFTNKLEYLIKLVDIIILLI